METAFWDTLHDGTILSVEPLDERSMRLQVDMGDMLDALAAAPVTVEVILQNCTRCGFETFDGEPVERIEPPGYGLAEIFGLVHAGRGTARVFCVNGWLILAYERAELRVPGVGQLTEEQLGEAAEKSFQAWRTK